MSTFNELKADLESRVIVIHNPDVQGQVLSDGTTEYIYECDVELKPKVSYKKTYNIKVYNAGTEQEKAFYYREDPPQKEEDLEIGLGIAYQKYGNFNYVADTKDGYKIQLSDGSFKVVKLNSDKTDLIEVSAV